MQKQQFSGHWWLPDNPDDKIGGELVYDPDDTIILDLNGSFDGVRFPAEVPVIFGETPSGERITLQDCILSSRKEGDDYKSLSVFVGGHFENDDVEFDKFVLKFPYLSQWMQWNAVGSDAENPLRIGVTFPDSVEVTVNGADVKYSLKAELNKQVFGDAIISQEVKITVTPNETVTTDAITDEYVYPLQNFLSFGLARHVSPTNIEGRIDGDEVEILYISDGEVKNRGTTIHPRRMFFCYPEVSDDFEEVLQTWFSSNEDLRPVHDLYFSNLRNQNLYPQNRFLSLSRALETYHRRTAGSQYYIEKSEYSDLNKELREVAELWDIPKDFQNKLNGTFGYANEYSLKKRLEELFEEQESVLEEIGIDPDTLAKQIRDTRNRLTHLPDREKSKYAMTTTHNIRELRLRTQMVLEACLLSDLGLGSGHIANRLTNVHRLGEFEDE